MTDTLVLRFSAKRAHLPAWHEDRLRAYAEVTIDFTRFGAVEPVGLMEKWNDKDQLSNLVFRAFLDSDGHTMISGPEYKGVDVDNRNVKRISRTLRRLQLHFETSCVKHGRPLTFGQHVAWHLRAFPGLTQICAQNQLRDWNLHENIAQFIDGQVNGLLGDCKSLVSARDSIEMDADGIRHPSLL